MNTEEITLIVGLTVAFTQEGERIAIRRIVAKSAAACLLIGFVAWLINPSDPTKAVAAALAWIVIGWLAIEVGRQRASGQPARLWWALVAILSAVAMSL